MYVREVRNVLGICTLQQGDIPISPNSCLACFLCDAREKQCSTVTQKELLSPEGVGELEEVEPLFEIFLIRNVHDEVTEVSMTPAVTT